MVQYNVSPEDFVRIWQRASSVREVSEKTKMPKGIVSARASDYRKEGVKLKKLKRERQKTLDIERLNEIAKEELQAAGQDEVEEDGGHEQGEVGEGDDQPDKQ